MCFLISGYARLYSHIDRTEAAARRSDALPTDR